MAPKRKPPAKEPAATLRALDDVVARLDRLDATLNQIELDLQPLRVLPRDLEATRQLALEAVAQAADALEAGSLSRVHEDRLNNLTLAVAEGIAHVDRAEKRIRATVGRAKRELRDQGIFHPGVEAEASDLRDVDGAAGEGTGVHTVQPSLEARPAEPDSLEAQLRALKLWNRA